MTRAPLRVAVFNDSATVRASIRVALASADDIQVVAERGHADQAAAVVAETQADVVVMDVVMPGVDGFEATRAIMNARPTPIVMVSSVVNPKDAQVIFTALEAGALHIAEPPPPPGAPDYLVRVARFQELLRTIAGARVRHLDAPRPTGAERPAVKASASLELDGIGVVSSAGGPQALLAMLPSLPRGAMPPLLLVQHLAAGFVESFARWLTSASSHPVEIAVDGSLARRGVVYMAPDGHHLWLNRRGRLVVPESPPSKGFLPSGDLLLERLGDELGARACGAILSGMGRDGADGASALRARGGHVVAQRAPAIDGMPRAAREADAVDAMLSAPEIGRWLAERSGLS